MSKIRFSHLRTLVVVHTIYKRYLGQSEQYPDSEYLAYEAKRDFMRLAKLYKVDGEYIDSRLSHG